MVGEALEKTTNLNLTLIEETRRNNHDYINANMQTLDAVISLYIQINNLQGPWENSTIYSKDDVVIDSITGISYICDVSHTSASTGTFAADRTNNPTYWTTYTGSVTSRGAWAANTSYRIGDFVTYDAGSYGIYAVCVSNHTSSSWDDDVDADRWVILLDPGTDVSAVEADAALAEADVALTEADVALTEADVAITEADLLATEADLALTNADVLATEADILLSEADVVLTEADVALTEADILLTEADILLTEADIVLTEADVALTNADVILTEADVVLTEADIVLTEADLSATGSDLLATEADVALTEADLLATEADVAAVANGVSLQGVIDASTNPDYPAADAGHLYRISVAGKIGGASGIDVEASDAIICLTTSASGDHGTVGANWFILQANISGLGTLAFQNTVNNADWSGTDLSVANGGTGVSTLTGLVKGNGASAFSAAAAGTDYLAPASTQTYHETAKIHNQLEATDYVIGYIDFTCTLVSAALIAASGTGTITLYLSSDTTSASGTAITGGAFSVSTSEDDNSLTGNNTVSSASPRYLVAAASSLSALTDVICAVTYTKAGNA